MPQYAGSEIAVRLVSWDDAVFPRLRAPAAVRNPAAGRWRRVREASYLPSYASPCLKLKLALVILNVLRALPQSAAIRSHQPGRCGYLLFCATLQRRLVVVLVVSFPWWCGGTSSLPGSSSFSSSNVVVIVLNVSKIQYATTTRYARYLCQAPLLSAWNDQSVGQVGWNSCAPASSCDFAST